MSIHKRSDVVSVMRQQIKNGKSRNLQLHWFQRAISKNKDTRLKTITIRMLNFIDHSYRTLSSYFTTYHFSAQAPGKQNQLKKTLKGVHWTLKNNQDWPTIEEIFWRSAKVWCFRCLFLYVCFSVKCNISRFLSKWGLGKCCFLSTGLPIFWKAE